MKKKLLFSLLLGSAFTWMNEMYAAETATPPAAGPEADKSAAAKEAKKYKAPSVSSTDGKTYAPGPEIEFSYYQENDQTIYDNIPIMDSGITQDAIDSMRKLPPDKRNSGPFVPGQELPKGYTIVNVWVKKDPNAPKDEKSKLFGLLGSMVSSDPSAVTIQTDVKGAASNISAPLDADHDIPADHNWALMNEKNEIFIPRVEIDPKAEIFYGDLKYSGDASITLVSQAFTRFFKIPNEEATKKLQEALKQLEEAKANGGGGGGASSEEVEQLKKKLAEVEAKQSSAAPAPAVDPSAPLTMVFEFEGMKFVIVTSAPEAKANPQLFEELKSNLYKLFSIQPKVATAIAAMMLKSNETPEGIQGEFVKVLIADAYKEMGSDKPINLVAELQFPTEVSFKEAYDFVEGLKTKYNREDEIREATAPIPAEEAARRQAEHEAELAAEKAKGEQILAELEEARREKAEAEAREKAARKAEEEANKKVGLLAEVAVEATARNITAAEQNAAIAAQNAQAVEVAEQEKQVLANQANAIISDVEAEKEKLAAVQQQTAAALSAAQVTEATLKAQKEAAEKAAQKAEESEEKTKEALSNAHDKLVQVVTAPSTDASPVVPPEHEPSIAASKTTAAVSLTKEDLLSAPPVGLENTLAAAAG